MSMKNRVPKTFTIKQLYSLYQKGYLIIPEDYQRRYVWGDLKSHKAGNELQSNLIHTTLMDELVPQIILKEEEVPHPKAETDERYKGKTVIIFYVMDGQQRCKTWFDFIENGYYLRQQTAPVDADMFPDIEDERIEYSLWLAENLNIIDEEAIEDAEGDYVISIAGKYFETLHNEMKEAIMAYDVSAQVLRNLTKKAERRIFSRLNTGVKLTEIERLRSNGGHVTELAGRIADLPFFAMDEAGKGKVAALSAKQNNRFINFELIIQMLMILQEGGNPDADGGVTGVAIGAKDYNSWVEIYAERELPQALKERAFNVVEYLGKAFTERESYLNKTAISSMTLVAERAMNDGMEPEHFAYIMHHFFHNMPAGYVSGKSNKTADKGSVKKRLDAMNAFYEEHKGNKKPYVAPSERKRLSKMTTVHNPSISMLSDLLMKEREAKAEEERRKQEEYEKNRLRSSGEAEDQVQDETEQAQGEVEDKAETVQS